MNHVFAVFYRFTLVIWGVFYLYNQLSALRMVVVVHCG